jgi:Beta/Gamma crystallin
MMMRKSIFWGVGLACAALALSSMLVGGAATARAADPVLVLGQNQNLSGTNWAFTGSDSNLSGQGGDQASSIKNNDPLNAWVVYENDSFGGRGYCIDPGELVTNLHISILNFGDRISSVEQLGQAKCTFRPEFFGVYSIAPGGSNRLILGRNQSLGGTNWAFTGSDSNLSGQGGDQASSIRNDDSRAWVVHENDGFGGRGYCITAGNEVSDLHSGILGFGDKISSVRRLGTPDCWGQPSFDWP